MSDRHANAGDGAGVGSNPGHAATYTEHIHCGGAADTRIYLNLLKQNIYLRKLSRAPGGRRGVADERAVR